MSGAASDFEAVRAAGAPPARHAYGRLLAYLAATTRNIAAAEDALGDAFASALATWPASGIPDKPEAWLLVAAKRRFLDGVRHARVRNAAEPTLALMEDDIADKADFPDARLKLMFVCAHPAIDEAARTPLMLQTVLGLDAARIASAFLTAPAAMSQRLVRAKTKIKDAGIAFEVPDAAELGPRLEFVLAAIYTAFTCGWDDLAQDARTALDIEAIWLGQVLASLLPLEAEVHGLLALMRHCHARRRARRDAAGAFVPLDAQDTTLWDKQEIARAEATLQRAAQLQRPGRYQLEAAIQSVHAGRAASGRTEWEALSLLYAALAELAPALGVRVGQAAVEARVRGPEAGLQLLDLLPDAEKQNYQPYWAVRAHLLREAGEASGARDAFARAMGLADDPAIRAYLAAQLDA
ncbi:MAG: RNA polymerase sigma factor [Rhodospirillales bacterium]